MSSITVGVYLGKKDRIVRYWYEILPKGQFPMLVKYCMQSYLLRKKFFPLHTICDPQRLKKQMDMRPEYTPTQRNVTFVPEDREVYKWVYGLASGYRSEEIKTILRETVIHTLLSDTALNNPAPQPAPYPQSQQPNMAQPVYSVDPRRAANQNMAYGAAAPTVYPEDTSPQHMIPGAMPVGEETPYQAWDKPPSQPIETAPMGMVDTGHENPGNQGIANNPRVFPIMG